MGLAWPKPAPHELVQEFNEMCTYFDKRCFMVTKLELRAPGGRLVIVERDREQPATMHQVKTVMFVLQQLKMYDKELMRNPIKRHVHGNLLLVVEEILHEIDTQWRWHVTSFTLRTLATAVGLYQRVDSCRLYPYVHDGAWRVGWLSRKGHAAGPQDAITAAGPELQGRVVQQGE